MTKKIEKMGYVWTCNHYYVDCQYFELVFDQFEDIVVSDVETCEYCNTEFPISESLLMVETHNEKLKENEIKSEEDGIE